MKKINKIKRLAVLSIFLILSLSLFSCNKITKSNYDKIQIGMSYKEVHDILGNPIDHYVDLTYDSYLWTSKGNSYEEALVLSQKGEKVTYIVVIFSTELTNSSPVVLRKTYGDLSETSQIE